MHNPFYSRLLFWAAVTGAAGVILGAFGAHALKARLEPAQLESLRTGVLYLFVHVLASAAVAGHGRAGTDSKTLRLSGIFFMTGILLFTGSIALLSTADLTGIPKGILGPVTPLGGVSFILGWIMLAAHARRH